MLLVLSAPTTPEPDREVPTQRRMEASALISIGLATAFGVRPLPTLPPELFHTKALRSITARARSNAPKGPIRVDSEHCEAHRDGLRIMGTVTCNERPFAYFAEIEFDPRLGKARVTALRVS